MSHDLKVIQLDYTMEDKRKLLVDNTTAYP